MTLEEIKEKLKYIKKISGDYENAHSYEDALMRQFIAHVAGVADAELAEMAKEVLKSSDINFSRYCA
jgi:UDP-N-acetyl-D-mannosaminuronate dehydrogenase